MENEKALKQKMILEKAQPSQDGELREFFSNFVLPGPIDVRLVRPKSFFEQYRLLTDTYDTWVLRGKEATIEGTFSFLDLKLNIFEKETPVIWCADLRINPNRRAYLGWLESFHQKLSETARERQIKHFLTIVPRTEGKTMSTLIRPRAGQPGISRFHLICPFEIVAVLGRLPNAAPPLTSLQVTPGEPEDAQALIEYLKVKSTYRPMGFQHGRDLFNRRLETWASFSIRDFLIAKTKDGKIVGCLGLWNNSRIQCVHPVHYHGFSASFKTALSFGSFLRWTVPLPDPGDRFHFSWITHLNADNPDIFQSLLYHAYEKVRPRRFLMYTHFPKEPLSLPPKGFVSAAMPFGLYGIQPSGFEYPEDLRQVRMKGTPEVEGVLV